MELYERIKKISSEMARTKSEMAERLGLPLSTFAGYLNEKRQDNLLPLLPKILMLFPQLSRDWLYFDEGEMLKAETPQPEENEAYMALRERNQELEAELKEERALNRRLTERLLLTRGDAAGNAASNCA